MDEEYGDYEFDDDVYEDGESEDEFDEDLYEGSDLEDEHMQEGSRDENTKQLIKALENRKKEEALEILRTRDINLDYLNNYRFSALTTAAMRGYLDIVKELIERGAKVNLPRQNSPLIQAIGYGHPEVAKYLIEQGADLIEGNRSALASAAGMHELDLVKQMVERGADVNGRGDRKRTALILGITDFDIVKYLVEHGADVNLHDEKKEITALMKAAEKGLYDTVKYLVEHGADVNAKDDYGRTAMDYVNGKRPMDLSNAKDKYKIIKYLLDHGADIESIDLDEHTSLQRAIIRGDYLLVKLLIEHGANLDVEDQNGRSLLIFASWKASKQSGKQYYGALKIVELLIDIGLDINYINRYDETALSLIDYDQQVGDLAHLLLSHGAIDFNDKVFNEAVRLKIPYLAHILQTAERDERKSEEKEQIVRQLVQQGNLLFDFVFQTVAYNDVDTLRYIKNNFNVNFSDLVTGRNHEPEEDEWWDIDEGRYYLRDETVKHGERYTLLSMAAFFNNIELVRYIYEAVETELDGDKKLLLRYLIRENIRLDNAFTIAYQACNKTVFAYLYGLLDQFSLSVKNYVYMKYLSKINPCNELQYAVVEFGTEVLTQREARLAAQAARASAGPSNAVAGPSNGAQGQMPPQTKPCGPRAPKGYSKDELVVLAMQYLGLTKYKANKLKVSDLCKLLWG